MTHFLASVRDAHEAHDALAGGADIIDFKDPAHGALGALAPSVIGCGIAALNDRTITSATAGDWPLDARVLIDAVRAIGATGVDYVKLGLLPGPMLPACLDQLRAVTRQHRVVAVFFADRGVPLAMLAHLRTAGFAGAMIDTFDKSSGGLRSHMSVSDLARFVRTAQRLGLMTGLAGSLSLEDIHPLAAIEPDLLGFRGALCEAAGRASTLALARVRRVRATLDEVLSASTPQASGTHRIERVANRR
jgi:(5-formylfuran-3-yl)methyl phosphate synthase